LTAFGNGYVERIIGSIRRECLDHVVVLGEAHLRRILRAYVTYDNEPRTHLSLRQDAPIQRPIRRFERIHFSAPRWDAPPILPDVVSGRDNDR
jgi:transposase InsO family protein